MKYSKAKQKQVEETKRKARRLYDEGFSLREVANIVKKTHEWVRWYAIKGKSRGNGLDKELTKEYNKTKVENIN